jgi:branched-chain amino acid transport system substrate-binding protein
MKSPAARSILQISAVSSACVVLGLSTAFAQDTVKVGVIGHFSGPFAAGGIQYKRGIETFVGLHGTKAGGREIELIFRDLGGANPAKAKQLTEELIVKDKVSVISGFALSPEPTAAASVVTETKTPTVIFNASDTLIPSQSPYFVRVGVPTWSLVDAQVRFALKNGKTRAFSSVADYSNGHATEIATKALVAKHKAGEIIGFDRVPLNSVDFSPFAERIANSKADFAYIFIGIGAPGVNYIKALHAQNVLSLDSKTWVIGTGETDDPNLKSFDDSAIGFYSSIPYALGLKNDENLKFLAFHKQKFGEVPGAFTVFAYDGIQVVYRMVEAQKTGKFDSVAAMDAARGYTWNSPRGSVKIEPDTRDLTQDLHVRQVRRVDDHLENVLVDTFPQIKDPWVEMGMPK